MLLKLMALPKPLVMAVPGHALALGAIIWSANVDQTDGSLRVPAFEFLRLMQAQGRPE